MNIHVMSGLKAGAKVLIDGQPYEASGLVGDGRVFVAKNGDEVILSHASQKAMAEDLRLLSDDLPKNIHDRIAQARAAEFRTFTFEERTTAIRRLGYIQALDRLPPRERRKKKIIRKCIDEVFKEQSERARLGHVVSPSLVPESGIDGTVGAEPAVDSEAERIRDKLHELLDREGGNHEAVPFDLRRPTPRNVRKWYRLYYGAGQDIRVLLDLHCLKGNHKERYPEPFSEAVKKVIDAKIACPTPVQYSQALTSACKAVRDAAAKTGEPLPELAKRRGGEHLLGQNLIARWVKKWDRFELTTRQQGIYEARRQFSTVELGPQGNHPNHEWEVDHTLLDIFVVDDLRGKAYGRPWLTAIIDRYSRCIVGFSLSFAPPSWVSIMDAMHVAVMRKDNLVAALNEGKKDRGLIRNEWASHGIPDYLITDHGSDFKSKSMDETVAALNIKPVQMKPRKPWLKGKIERWFRTLEDQLVHTIPGTTFSDLEKRKFYKSEEFIILTLTQLNWVVTKWVVDVYHQTEHSKLRCSPSEMWKGGLRDSKPPRLIPAALFKPLMGRVIQRVIRKGGVTFLGLRWDSEAWVGLRKRTPEDSEATIRIDPLDLNTAWALDETTGEWVEGRLIEPNAAKECTLDQWYFINARRKKNIADGMERQEALEQAVEDISRFITDIQAGYSNSKAWKRYLEYTTQGRSAWDKVLPPRWDEDDDGPPGSHSPGQTRIRSPRKPRPPFRENPPPGAGLESQDEGPESGETDAGGNGNAPDDVTGKTETPEAAAKGRRPQRRPPARARTPDSQAAAPVAPMPDPDGFKDDDFETAPINVRTIPTENTDQ